MKRHIALQPLSRQHHTALLAVLLLKKGIARQAPPPIMRAFVQQVWDEDLQPHFRAEEEWLLPAVQQPATENLVRQMLEEHAQLRTMHHQMMVKDADSAVIGQFASMLEQHVRWEERVCFPAMEPFIDPALSERLLRLEDAGGARCLQFEPKFWE
jgi:hemerythrin-like domain-containing protein